MASIDLTHRAQAGLSGISAVAVLSAVAAAGLLYYILVFKILRNRNDPRVPLLDNAMPYLFVNLLVLDIVMAVGSAINIQWAVDGRVYAGGYCTAQAVTKQIGNNGVAWQTTAIAVYSVFWYNQWNDQRPHVTGPAIVLAIWVGLAILTAVPPSIDPGVYGPAGKWCWIPGDERDVDRITTTYMWFWVCAVVTLIAYTGIYLDAAGRLAGAFGRKGVWIGLKSSAGGWGCGLFGLAPSGEPIRPPNQSAEVGSPRNDQRSNGAASIRSDRSAEARERIRKAKNLLWYPVGEKFELPDQLTLTMNKTGYTLVILPQSIIRLIELNKGVEMPLWATIFGGTILATSGLLNAFLYLGKSHAGCRHFGIPEPEETESPSLPASEAGEK